MTALRHERSGGTEGYPDSFLHLGTPAPARSENTRHHRGHAHHADVHSFRGIVQRHRRGEWHVERAIPRNFRRAARDGDYIEELNLPGHAGEWAQVAVEKLSAKSVEAGRYDLILQPTNLWLTIHESIGHPTELDRAMGFEANFAGTSFVNPPEKMINKLQYGKPLMNIQGDRTQEHSVGLCAWDDEGVPADKWLIIDKGIFKEYQTTREQASWVAPLTGTKHSHGCSYADSWSDVQFQRMPNVSRSCPPKKTRRSTTSSPPRTAASRFAIAARGRSTTSATTSPSPARRSTRSRAGRSDRC